MTKKIQAIRGMNDVLPDESHIWQFVERKFAECMKQYGFNEIRFPIVESTQLFKRSIGEVTDIVEKEMYTFDDLNGESLTLRPEGTAGCVRACIEHSLVHNQQQKLWYTGPMFRHEKPQKGRYRQFHQFGIEAIGFEGVTVELEVIALTKRLWTKLGIAQELELEINTLGTLEERNAYKSKLVSYFKEHFDLLDDDSKRRLESNPMRILDSKNPDMRQLIINAPKLFESLNEQSQTHFDAFCSGLAVLGINYTINPTLVRGLDYYGHTVFEWVTNKLGSQSAVCAGGRYDGLVEQIGGKPTPAFGFGLGQERLILLMQAVLDEELERRLPDFYIINTNQSHMDKALLLSESIRNMNPELSVEMNLIGGSMKSQFKKADKSGARYALILGDDEIENQTIGIKYLREEQAQTTIAQDELESFINHTCLG